MINLFKLPTAVFEGLGYLIGTKGKVVIVECNFCGARHQVKREEFDSGKYQLLLPEGHAEQIIQ